MIMKKLFILSILLFAAILVTAQKNDNLLTPNLKFGKPSDKELSFTTYEPDTTAAAVCLINQGKTYYTYNNDFELTTERTVRIKILKSQGMSHANVTIPYYYPEDETKERDRIEELEGYSYNLENGKYKETPLTKEMTSDEKVDKYHRILKFSLPAVKAGTVIEYRYKYHSNYFHLIDTWIMQKEIPVVYGEYEISIPYMFVFNIETRRKEYIEIKQKETSMRAAQYAGGAGYADVISVPCQQYTFTSHNLPAIKEDEPFCWCPDDHKTQIIFNLKGTYDTNEKLVSRSKEWEDIDKNLLNVENYRFGQLLTYENPLREATKAAFSSEMSTQERIITAFQVLRKHIAWNGFYEFYGTEFSKILKAGSGSNSELNFILISILKDYGLKAYPVVMKLRSSGILPPTFPTLDKLETFIVGVHDLESDRFWFLDSSMAIPSLNVLPLELSVTRARLLSPTVSEEKKWVNLVEQCPNVTFIQTNASINEKTITGKRITTLSGQYAVEYLKKQQTEKEDTDNAKSGNQTTVVFTNTQIDQSPSDLTKIKEEQDFTLQITHTGDRLYVNPMLFSHLTNNPFIQSKRELPIEFPYPYTFALNSELTLPEGYVVEEMPKSQVVRTDDNLFICKYMIEQKGNRISVNYIFNLKAYQFSTEKYKQLQEIWSKVIDKNNATIVLKKI